MAARAPPFFPSSGPKPHDAGAGARPAAEGAISVSELTRRVKVSLERDPALSSVRVRGEMSNFLHHSSGHMYFVLKDEEAVLRCVLWNGTARKLRFSPQDGLEVVAHGSITVYPRRGEYQLTVAVLEPAGEGALYAAFLRMKAKLEGEGLFAADRKRPISPFPRRVVIVTSREGAVLHDFLRISRRRDPAVEVVLVPAPVQGPDAAPELALALGRAANVPGADVVVLARGGGSLEDLWAFNEEVLARAIAASPVPVVSAVGHETDYTIADFVADLRAPTPSAAAEVLVPDRETLRRRVRLTAEALRQHLLRRALHARERYARFAEASVLARPDRWMATRAQGLDDASLRLSRVMRVLVARWTERTRADETLLASLSPESTLLRGYAIVRRDDGTVLSTAQAARPGEGLRVELSDGIVTTQVTKVDIHGRRTRE